MDNVYKFFGLLFVAAVVALLMALPIMWLWNWLMPHLFGLIQIDFLEALGISFLSQLLFKSNNTSGSSK